MALNRAAKLPDLLPLAQLAAQLQPRTVRMAQRPSSRRRATCPRSRRPQATRCRNPRQLSRAHSSCPLPLLLLQPAPRPHPRSKVVAPPPKATLLPSKRPRPTLPSLDRPWRPVAARVPLLPSLGSQTAPALLRLQEVAAVESRPARNPLHPISRSRSKPPYLFQPGPRPTLLPSQALLTILLLVRPTTRSLLLACSLE